MTASHMACRVMGNGSIQYDIATHVLACNGKQPGGVLFETWRTLFGNREIYDFDVQPGDT